jgi:hypothetical protein
MAGASLLRTTGAALRMERLGPRREAQRLDRPISPPEREGGRQSGVQGGRRGVIDDPVRSRGRHALARASRSLPADGVAVVCVGGLDGGRGHGEKGLSSRAAFRNNQAARSHSAMKNPIRNTIDTPNVRDGRHHPRKQTFGLRPEAVGRLGAHSGHSKRGETKVRS